mmetsp:Transcript_22930/g.58545  ORF Transcript_22930/g.58545 Transcript_22930/m.58545 type:complete len:227 (-) Transcript_22930:524-1204(-)
MRSSRPCTPLGMRRKSWRPASFCADVKDAWSVATWLSTPPASAFFSARLCGALLMGGLMTYCAASEKFLCHSRLSSSASALATGSPITRCPASRAAATSCMASMLMTCTTYSGTLTRRASLMARPVASPSTTAGRDSGWPSGPVTPISSYTYRCPYATASPFSACTMGSAPSSLQRARPSSSSSSLTCSAPLYAMKNLNELTPCSASRPMSADVFLFQRVTAMWKE